MIPNKGAYLDRLLLYTKLIFTSNIVSLLRVMIGALVWCVSLIYIPNYYFIVQSQRKIFLGHANMDMQKIKVVPV